MVGGIYKSIPAEGIYLYLRYLMLREKGRQMNQSMLEKGAAFESEGDYFAAFKCYTKIWADKLLESRLFTGIKDEIITITCLENLVVIAARDNRIYLLDSDLTPIRDSIEYPGRIISLQATAVSKKYLSVLFEESVKNDTNNNTTTIRSTLHLYDDSFNKLPHQFPVGENENILCTCFLHRERDFLIAGTDNENVFLYDLESENRLILFSGIKNGENRKILTLTAIDFDNDGQEEVVAGGINRLYVLPVEKENVEPVRIKFCGSVNAIFPKKRSESNHIEGIFLVSDNSTLQFLKTNSDKLKTLTVFPADPLCGLFYDIDRDEAYEILIGCENNRIYMLTDQGEVRKEIKTSDEVRDICILPGQEEKKVLQLLVGMGDNRIVAYECARKSYIWSKILSCYQNMENKDEIGKLTDFFNEDEDEYNHLHEFAIIRLQELMESNLEESVELLDKIISRNSNTSFMIRSVYTAIKLFMISLEKGKEIFLRLADMKNKYLRQKIFKELTALINDPNISMEKKSITISFIGELNQKYNAPLEKNIWGELRSYMEARDYKSAHTRCEKLLSNKIDLLWEPIYLNDHVPISRIYAKDITGDNLDEILFRAKNGYLYCYDLVGQKIWVHNTHDSSSSLVASNIIGSKRRELGFTSEPKDVIYGTSTGGINILNADKNHVVSDFFTNQKIETITSLGNHSIRIGLENGSIIAYEFLSDKLKINNQWHFRAKNCIHSIYAYDLLDDGVDELIIGSRDRTIYILRHNGEELTRFQCSGAVRTLSVSRKNKENKNKILACCRNGLVYILEFSNEKLTPLQSPLDLGCNFIDLYLICDVDMNNIDEIVFIREGNQLIVTDQQGKEKWNYQFEHTVTALNYIESDIEGYPNLVIGFENGVLVCYRTFDLKKIEEMKKKCEGFIVNTGESHKQLSNIYIYTTPLEFNKTNHDAIHIMNLDLNSSSIEPVLQRIKNRGDDHKKYFNLVWGGPGTGKTTLLNYLYKEIPQFSKRTVPVIVNFQKCKLKTIPEFFYSLSVLLFGSLKKAGILYGYKYDFEDFTNAPYNVMGAFLDSCFSMLKGKRLLILGDNIDVLYKQQIGNETIEYLARRAIRHHIIFIFTSRIEDNLLQEGLHIKDFDPLLFKLKTFSVADIKKLLAGYSDPDFNIPQAADIILKLTEGNPFLVQLLLNQLIVFFNDNPGNQKITELISDFFFNKIVDIGSSYFETLWQQFSLYDQLKYTLVATYISENSLISTNEELLRQNETALFVLDPEDNFESVIEVLLPGNISTLYKIWIQRFRAFPMLLLIKMEQLRRQIPLSLFYTIDDELRKFLKPVQINDFFRMIMLDRFTWNRVVFISRQWVKLKNKQANIEAVCESIIMEIVRRSDFSLFEDDVHVKIRGGIYYMKIKIEKKTLLARENYICIIPGNITEDQIIKNINGIRQEADSHLCLVFALFEKETPEINSIRARSRWTVCFTEKMLNDILFSKMEIADAFWDLALEQIDISIISPYSVTDKADITFVGRDNEIDMICKPPFKNYALLGGRLIGKTSLLHQINSLLSNNPGINIIHINCDPMGKSKNRNLYDVFIRLVNNKYRYNVDTLDEFFSKLWDIKKRENKRTILILDEVDFLIKYDQKKQNNFLFLRSIHNLYENNICSAILAGYIVFYHSKKASNSPHLSFFKDVRIDFLDDSAIRRLILEPVSDLKIHFKREKTDELIRLILTHTSNHPCYIQAFCQLLISELVKRKSRIIDKEIINYIGDDESFWNFVDWSFLKGSVITNFDKIVIHCMLPVKNRFSLDDLINQLTLLKLPFSYTITQIETAVENLILANILEQEKEYYKFRNPVLFKKILALHKINSLLEGGNIFNYE